MKFIRILFAVPFLLQATCFGAAAPPAELEVARPALPPETPNTSEKWAEYFQAKHFVNSFLFRNFLKSFVVDVPRGLPGGIPLDQDFDQI